MANNEKTENAGGTVSFENVIDMKMTRNEIIDLIIEEMTDELNDKIKAQVKVCNALREKRDAFDTDWMKNAWEAGVPVKDHKEVDEVTFHRHSYHDEDDGERVYVIQRKQMNIRTCKVPQAMLDARKAYNSADAVLDELRNELSKLQAGKGKARTQVIRAHLETTQQGKSVLGLIDGAKNAMKQKLLK